MSRDFDVAIVGGGLGGAALARAWQSTGRECWCSNVEQQVKDRVRGEFLTPWGVVEARTLGIDGLLRETCAHEVP